MKSESQDGLASHNALLITLDEACSLLSCSRYKLEQLFIAQEIARPVHIGACLRVLAKDVENYLRRQKAHAQQKRSRSLAQAMDWMGRTSAEESAILGSMPKRYSSNDPSRLP